MRSHDPLNAQIARQASPPTSKADLDYTQGYDLGWQLGAMAAGIGVTMFWMLIFLAVFLIAGVRVTVQ